MIGLKEVNYAILYLESLNIICITNRKSVSISASYCYYCFSGDSFAKSALNSIDPLQGPTHIFCLVGPLLGP